MRNDNQLIWEAEANGYLDQLEGMADFDNSRSIASLRDDPLEDNSYLKNRITKTGKVNKQDIEQRKKGYKKTKDTSVIGRKKPSLPR